MNVKQLKQQLEYLDDDMEVVVSKWYEGEEWGYFDVEYVTEKGRKGQRVLLVNTG